MGCNGGRGVKAGPINPANKQSGGGVGTQNKSTRSEARGGSDKRRAVWLTAQWEIQRGDNKVQRRQTLKSAAHQNYLHFIQKSAVCIKPVFISHNAKLLWDDVFEEWMLGGKSSGSVTFTVRWHETRAGGSVLLKSRLISQVNVHLCERGDHTNESPVTFTGCCCERFWFLRLESTLSLV